MGLLSLLRASAKIKRKKKENIIKARGKEGVHLDVLLSYIRIKEGIKNKI